MSTHSRTTEQAFDAAIAAAVLNPARPHPKAVSGPNGKAAIKRFNVYRNNVTHSLVTALAEIFPVVAQIIGEDNFRLVARDFVRTSPPKSRLVFEYGQDFPAFLAKYEQLKSLKYLPDIARLERAWLDSYHACDAPSLTSEAIAACAPETIPSLRFLPHPATRLLASDFAIHTIFLAHRTGPLPERIEAARPENALITRPDLKVTLYRLDLADTLFVSRLIEGASLQSAAEQATEADEAFDLGSAIQLTVQSGAFSSILEPKE